MSRATFMIMTSTEVSGSGEEALTEDNLTKNCGGENEEREPQLGHHPEAGQ